MKMMTTRVESYDVESIMKWFENRMEEGENGIVVYPDLQHSEDICRVY